MTLVWRHQITWPVPGAFYGGSAWDQPKARRNGVYAEESKTAFRDIEDGTSSTIMAGEVVSYGVGNTGPEEDTFYWNARWYGSFKATNGKADAPESQFRNGQEAINPPHTSGKDRRRNAFASSHPGGANMLFADASVRLVSETIETTGTSFKDFSKGASLGVYQRLTSKNDGLVVENF